MHDIVYIVSRFIKKETGTTAIEYGFIASMIAAVIVGVLLAIGTSLDDAFTKVQSSFNP